MVVRRIESGKHFPDIYVADPPVMMFDVSLFASARRLDRRWVGTFILTLLIQIQILDGSSNA